MNRLLPVMTVAALGLLSTQAKASPITDSGSVPFTQTNWADSVTLDQFDDLGGTRTLDSVVLRLNTRLQGSFTVNATTNTDIGRLEIAAITNATPSFLTPVTLSTNLGEEVVSFSDPVVTVLAGDSETFTISGTGGIISTFNETTLTTGLSNFIGAGTFNVNIQAFSASTVTNFGGNFSQSQTTLGDAEVIVTYNFTDDPPVIPTPAMLPGLVGMGIAFWRKKISGDQAIAEAEENPTD
jgi:hypothetical protein